MIVPTCVAPVEGAQSRTTAHESIKHDPATNVVGARVAAVGGLGGPPASAEIVPASADVGIRPRNSAWRQLRRNKVAMASATVVAIFALIAIFAPLICDAFGVSPDDVHTELVGFDDYPLVGPSWQHPFGVAPVTGRDLFATWVYGARYSLLIAVIAASVATALGVVLGLLAGYLGGWVDRVVSWVIDLFLTMPFLLLAATLAATLSATVGRQSEAAYTRAQFISLIVVLSAFGWMGMARLVRAQVMSLREEEFVLAARVVGCSTRHILVRELLPNLTVPIVLGLSLGIPAVVTAEAGLSLLGIGLTDLPSWGNTIRNAQGWWRADPSYLLQPVAALLVLVLALNLLGDAVRDALDPKTRR
jgi:peptide/nickel transport system permease protein